MSAEDNPPAEPAEIGEALVAALGFEPTDGLKLGRKAGSSASVADELSEAQTIVEDPNDVPSVDDAFSVVSTEDPAEKSAGAKTVPGAGGNGSQKKNGSKNSSNSSSKNSSSNGQRNRTRRSRAGAGSTAKTATSKKSVGSSDGDDDSSSGGASTGKRSLDEIKSAAKPTVSEADARSGDDVSAGDAGGDDARAGDAGGDTASATTGDDPVAKAKAETEAIRKRLEEAKRKAGIVDAKSTSNSSSKVAADVNVDSHADADADIDADADVDADASSETLRGDDLPPPPPSAADAIGGVGQTAATAGVVADAVPTSPPAMAPIAEAKVDPGVRGDSVTETVPSVEAPVLVPQAQPATAPQRSESTLPNLPFRNPFRRRRRVQARKVRRVVRHIDPWSVLTFSVLFHLCVFAALLLASVLVWNAAEAAGTIENLETFILELGDYETYEIHGDVVFQAAVAIAGILTLASSVMLVLLTVVFNLISDLVGGIRLTVIEEETVRVRRRKAGA